MQSCGPLSSLVRYYAQLRSTPGCKFFLEKFKAIWSRSILEENAIVSVTNDGCILLVSVDDIADVAFFDEKSHNMEHIIVGPELYSYDIINAGRH